MIECEFFSKIFLKKMKNECEKYCLNIPEKWKPIFIKVLIRIKYTKYY